MLLLFLRAVDNQHRIRHLIGIHRRKVGGILGDFLSAFFTHHSPAVLQEDAGHKGFYFAVIHTLTALPSSTGRR